MSDIDESEEIVKSEEPVEPKPKKAKAPKEPKEAKEPKPPKEPKEPKPPKEPKEPKEAKQPREPKEPIEAKVLSAEEAKGLEEAARVSAERVRSILDQENHSFWDLAKELYTIREGGLYVYLVNPETGAPYSTMKDYLRIEVAGSERKGRLAMTLWEAVAVKHGEDFLDQIKHLGPSKIDLLKDMFTSPEVTAEWIKLAEELTRDQLAARVRLYLNPGDAEESAPEGAVAQTKKKTVELTEDQENIWNHAVKLAQQLHKEENQSVAIIKMMSEYTLINADMTDSNLEGALASLEKTYGVSLVALDFEEADPLLYGKENLKTFADIKRKATAS